MVEHIEEFETSARNIWPRNGTPSIYGEQCKNESRLAGPSVVNGYAELQKEIEAIMCLHDSNASACYLKQSVEHTAQLCNIGLLSGSHWPAIADLLFRMSPT